MHITIDGAGRYREFGFTFDLVAETATFWANNDLSRLEPSLAAAVGEILALPGIDHVVVRQRDITVWTHERRSWNDGSLEERIAEILREHLDSGSSRPSQGGLPTGFRPPNSSGPILPGRRPDEILKRKRGLP